LFATASACIPIEAVHDTDSKLLVIEHGHEPSYNVAVKAAPILVFLALIILPFLIRLIFVIYQLAKEGVKSADSIWKPSPTLERFRSEHKVLFYLPVVVYGILFFASLFWIFYEVILPAFGMPTTLLIMYGGLMVIVIGIPVIWVVRRLMRINATVPRPAPGSPPEAMEEWQKKYYAEIDKDNAGCKSYIYMFLVTMGVALLYMAIVIVFLMNVSH